MKLYCGIDLHSNNNVHAIVNEKGEIVSRKKLDNDLRLVLKFLAPFKSSLAGVVIESTFNWYWLVDGLEEAGFVVHLANTAAIQQYSGLKHGDDNSRSGWLTCCV